MKSFSVGNPRISCLVAGPRSVVASSLASRRMLPLVLSKLAACSYSGVSFLQWPPDNGGYGAAHVILLKVPPCWRAHAEGSLGPPRGALSALTPWRIELHHDEAVITEGLVKRRLREHEHVRIRRLGSCAQRATSQHTPGCAAREQQAHVRCAPATSAAPCPGSDMSGSSPRMTLSRMHSLAQALRWKTGKNRRAQQSTASRRTLAEGRTHPCMYSAIASLVCCPS